MTNTELITKASSLAATSIADFLKEGTKHYSDMVKSTATLAEAMNSIHGPSIPSELWDCAEALINIGEILIETHA